MSQDGENGLVGEPPYYTVSMAGNAGTGNAYHVTSECQRLNRAKTVRERSAKYVKWHDMDPCAYCTEGDG